MKEETNILLLADIPPCKNNVRGISLSKIIRFLLEEKVNVSFFCIKEKNFGPEFYTDIQNNYDLEILPKPIEQKEENNSEKNFYKEIKKIQKELNIFIKEKRINKIFCSLDDEALTFLLNNTYNKFKIPYVVGLQNDIEEWVLDNNFSEIRSINVKEKYDEVLKNAKKIIVTSRKMSNEIIRKYNITKKLVTYVDTVENEEKCQVFKEKFFDAMEINYAKSSKKLHILEVNNIDESGRRFNGYDLIEEINNNTIHSAKQIVTVKDSKNKNVGTFFDNWKQLCVENELLDQEKKVLSVHNQISLTSNLLMDSDYFKNADIVHYHLIHNTKLSLYKMIELSSMKPTILSFHDTWNFTGRCVAYEDCEKWKSGCKNCQHLETMFPFSQDNCNSLWKLKKKVYDNIDVDIIVSTPYMLNLIKESPLTKNLTHVHLIPFGIDLNKFKESDKEKARNNLSINKDDIVLFFRAQKDFKGTEYIVEAMKKLNTDKKITLLSCSEKGLLSDLKDKYTVVDLGTIKDDKLIEAYSACDMFLMPSKTESFGLMAIEAMACSRPVIIFDNTALPSVTFAPECGVLVENKNTNKLMEAIGFLIDNEKERQRRGQLGRKLTEQHYDIKKYHEKILKVYEESYERQKNKKKIIQNISIDYMLKDVRKLDEKLSYIYKKIVKSSKIPSFLHSEGLEFDDKYIIDYSNENVQNLLTLFNEELTKELKKISLPKEKKLTLKYSLHLLKTDRSYLIYRISKKIKSKRSLYRFTRKTYHGIKKAKQIILPFNNKKNN